MSRFLSRIRGHADSAPERAFCHFVTPSETRALTWRDFAVNVSGYAETLRGESGVVLIFLRHTPHLYWSFFGAMFAGLVPSFMPCLSPKQSPEIYWRSHAKLLEHIDPATIISDAETLAEMQSNGLDITPYRVIDIAMAKPGSGDLVPAGDDKAVALLQHSSGTTGLKKGVALTGDAIVRQLDSYSRSLSLTPSDVLVSWLPVYHDMGLVACLLLPIYAGVPVVHTDPFHWLSRPSILFDQITAHRATLCWLPNFAFEHIERTCRREMAVDLTSIRALIDCSEPCKAPTFDRFLARFRRYGLDETKLQVCYAMAEAVFAVTQTALGRPTPRFVADTAALQEGRAVEAMGGTVLLSAGREIDGIHALVLDQDGGPLPEGRLGEIALNGDFLFAGYYKNSALSKSKIVDGFYHTGDIGFRLDGELFIIGRADDLLIVNGKNIYAHEVEAIVTDSGQVKPGRVAAISAFNEAAGSDVLVVIAESEQAVKTKDLSDAVFSQIGVMPWEIRIVPPGWLIKTTSGKTSRKENKTRYLEEAGQ